MRRRYEVKATGNAGLPIGTRFSIDIEAENDKAREMHAADLRNGAIRWIPPIEPATHYGAAI